MYVCMYVCTQLNMYVLVLCPKTGPWHPNSSLFVLPYEYRVTERKNDLMNESRCLSDVWSCFDCNECGTDEIEITFLL